MCYISRTAITINLLLLLHLELVRALSISNDILHETGEEFYSYFIREAPLHTADYYSNNSIEDIPWLNMNMLDRAANYYRDHFVGISVAHIYALIEIFALKSTSSVLLSTGHFGNRSIAYTRLLKTVLNVRKWCSAGSKIFDPRSDAYKSLQVVKRRHRSASYTYTESSFNNIIVEKRDIYENMEENRALARAIREDLANIDTREAPMHLLQWNSSFPVGQFDLGVVQFLFFSHSTMFPRSYGVLPSSLEDRKAFVHLWAVLGRILGIQDRFNVALNLPLKMYTHFYKNIVIASLKNVDETVISLMSNTVEGFQDNFFYPLAPRLKCLLMYALSSSIEGFKGHNIKKLMNSDDELCIFSITVGISAINTSRFVYFANRIVMDSFLTNELERLAITH